MMNITSRIATYGLLSTALALSACGKNEPPVTSATTPAVVAAVAGAATAATATVATEPKKRTEGNTEREQGTMQVVKVSAPLSNLFGYVTKLRTLSQGRAVYTMAFSHYEPVNNK